MIIWLFGLSGSGKTTIAKALQKKLESESIGTACLDGDVIREMFLPLGFSKEARRKNLLRATLLAKTLNSSFQLIICSFITPYNEIRNFIKKAGVKLVYVKCPLEECINRDPKGLYARAITGEIKNFTGISDPFEEPESVDLEVNTSLLSVDDCVDKIIERFKL